MKIKYNKVKQKNSSAIRTSFENYYINKFFNMWMNKIELDGLNYQQSEFIMKKFWFEGTIACSEPVGIPKDLIELMDEDRVIFTPWVVSGLYNIYDYPIKALPVNLRGVAFISTKPLVIDEEIVIGYCQKNHKSIYQSIVPKIKELVDIEMVKRIALKSQKMPWLFTGTPENKTAIDKLANDLDSDDPTLFTTLEDSQLAKGLTSGSPYILDKLEQQRQKLENDILTFLGVNNVGIAEKKEHLVVDEINANNQEIAESGDNFLDMFKQFFDRIEKVFNFKVNPKLKEVKMPQFEEDLESEDEENDQ